VGVPKSDDFFLTIQQDEHGLPKSVVILE